MGWAGTEQGIGIQKAHPGVGFQPAEGSPGGLRIAPGAGGQVAAQPEEGVRGVVAGLVGVQSGVQQAAAPIDGDASGIKLGGGGAGVSGSKLGGDGDDGATLPTQQGEGGSWGSSLGSSLGGSEAIRERQAGKEGGASGGGRGHGLRQVEELAGGQVEGGAGRFGGLQKGLLNRCGEVEGAETGVGERLGQDQQAGSDHLLHQVQPSGVIQGGEGGRVFQIEQHQRDLGGLGGAQQVIQPVPPAERTGVGAIPTAQGGGGGVGGVGIPESQQNVGGGGRRVVGAEDGGLVNGAGRAGGGDEDLQLQGGKGWRERRVGEQRGQVQRDIDGVGGGVAEDGQGGAGAGGAIGLEDLEATVGRDDQQGIPGDISLSLEWEPVHAAGAALQGQVEVVVELVDTGEQVEADVELVAGAAQVDGDQVVGGEVGVSGVEQAQVGVAPGGEDGGRGRLGCRAAGSRAAAAAAGSQAESQEEEADMEGGGSQTDDTMGWCQWNVTIPRVTSYGIFE